MEEFSTVSRVLRCPALLTKMSTARISCRTVLKTWDIAFGSQMSAMKDQITISYPWELALVMISFTADSRVPAVRPRMTTARAPALLKAVAIDFPTPLPPPVTRTALHLAERAWLVGSMAGYTELWKVFVKEGKGRAILER
jgi:hypothetical protein